MYDYNQYESGSDNNQTSGNNGGNGGDEPDKNLTLTPYAPIEGEFKKVFGNANNWGQSLGVAMENVTLVDGCLYHDPEKNKYKVFNWEEVIGVMPGDDHPVEADDANQFLAKSYGSTNKRYELVEAVVMANGDDPVDIGNAIMWYGGTEEYGPKAASRTLAKLLTVHGKQAVVDDGDIHNWLADTSGDDLLREDLRGRRYGFFEVKKQSNQSKFKFNHPIVKDTETGKDVRVQNGRSEESGSAPAAAPAATDGGTAGTVTASAGDDEMPEAIEDFVSTCQTLQYNEPEKVEALLTDLINDDGADLTLAIVDGFGGTDAVIGAVVN